MTKRKPLVHSRPLPWHGRLGRGGCAASSETAISTGLFLFEPPPTGGTPVPHGCVNIRQSSESLNRESSFCFAPSAIRHSNIDSSVVIRISSFRHFLICALGLLPLVCTGCIIGREHPAATQPATAIDPKLARSSYWFDQPPIVRITATDFDRLWNACSNAAQDDGFIIDRTDYRNGVLTTLPLVSKQFYEIWKHDVITPHDLAQSTLGTMRRTVRFDFRRLEDGTYEATPKVVVERDSMIERRITSVDQYQSVFSIRLTDIGREVEQTGAADIPPEYYYAEGRDPALEKQLADAAQRRISKRP